MAERRSYDRLHVFEERQIIIRFKMNLRSGFEGYGLGSILGRMVTCLGTSFQNKGHLNLFYGVFLGILLLVLEWKVRIYSETIRLPLRSVEYSSMLKVLYAICFGLILETGRHFGFWSVRLWKV